MALPLLNAVVASARHVALIEVASAQRVPVLGLVLLAVLTADRHPCPPDLTLLSVRCLHHHRQSVQWRAWGHHLEPACVVTQVPIRCKDPATNPGRRLCRGDLFLIQVMAQAQANGVSFPDVMAHLLVARLEILLLNMRFHLSRSIVP